MLKFFKKKPKEKSCVNCTYYKKKENRCTATRNSTLRAFPFKKNHYTLTAKVPKLVLHFSRLRSQQIRIEIGFLERLSCN